MPCFWLVRSCASAGDPAPHNAFVLACLKKNTEPFGVVSCFRGFEWLRFLSWGVFRVCGCPRGAGACPEPGYGYGRTVFVLRGALVSPTHRYLFLECFHRSQLAGRPGDRLDVPALGLLLLLHAQLHVEKSIKFAKAKFSDWDPKTNRKPQKHGFLFVFDPSQRMDSSSFCTLNFMLKSQ